MPWHVRQNPHSTLVPFLKDKRAGKPWKDSKTPLYRLQKSSLWQATSSEKGLLGVRQQAGRAMLSLLGSRVNHRMYSLMEDRQAPRTIIDMPRTSAVPGPAHCGWKLPTWLFPLLTASSVLHLYKTWLQSSILWPFEPASFKRLWESKNFACTWVPLWFKGRRWDEVCDKVPEQTMCTNC